MKQSQHMDWGKYFGRVSMFEAYFMKRRHPLLSDWETILISLLVETLCWSTGCGTRRMSVNREVGKRQFKNAIWLRLQFRHLRIRPPFDLVEIPIYFFAFIISINMCTNTKIWFYIFIFIIYPKNPILKIYISFSIFLKFWNILTYKKCIQQILLF